MKIHAKTKPLLILLSLTPLQPFHGCHLRFHNFFHPGFLKAAPFLDSLVVFVWISLL